jgi:DNA-directed RNA polymerase II subunit RPB1
MSSNSNYLKSQIVGIQFSVLSPEEIRKGSVAEITNRDTYVNNKPVIGGLFDPRMGVLEPGLTCPTDGLDYIKTPGYFGHIELAKPVYYIQYLNTVIKLLRCICFKCSKLLIDKEKFKHFMKLPNDTRWNTVFQYASKVKRCGDDNCGGCGCKQPNKIKKEGLANIFAEWDNSDGWVENGENTITVKVTAELAIKLFRRISDEDVTFMGFSPLWSRPEWMICEVLAVPPPSVRPSVKHDAQQRSEDDITHILVNIIKTNKVLQERIEQKAAPNVIEDWSLLLQYYVATQVDNNIPGVHSVAQRSGRPLKSIKERLNGKTGRVRGNLMGKRVDYSARSVITADPNLSTRELGIPLKIAKNITKPVYVNNANKKFLTKLVQNGPDEWPGAKILEKKNKESISLRYVDRNNVKLENGDIVHRHMLNGDAILFNRQPTLHRMSMMCHIARILKVGDTFRMNVADTKPYNADFDGDEMNLHMPQDEESESELLNLAHVPYQIVSPANNSPIVGIFQDSLLGAYQFTRDNIKFSHRDAMNILMNSKNIDLSIFDNKEVSSFNILSQILPPISLKYKTRAYKDSENYDTSNHVIDIEGSEYIRGQLEKGTLGSSTKGILHRICNDFGNMASSKFIDDLQNIVTEYMKTSSYSVGPSDLISNKENKTQIDNVIENKKNQVIDLIDKIQLGVFENDTGKKNIDEFETKVANILNQATAESGKIGRNNLNKNNRFVTMVNAGSKGSDLNISFMISCLGQQNVNGKRIPYGYDDRTLPHFNKFDDTPSARGFVENSYINGLEAEELFFHAQGGRVGLIDTAVKTSQTGYIQRRLIKGMEDLKVEYDMTVRNNKGKIVQFTYGDDGFDTVKVENQHLPIVNNSLEEIYAHFYFPYDQNMIFTEEAKKMIKKQKNDCNEKIKKTIDLITNNRTRIVDNIFKNKNDSRIHIPVAFTHIIANVQKMSHTSKNSLVDITPLDAYNMIDNTFNKFKKINYCQPNDLFEIMYYYYLCPRELLLVKRFNKSMLTYLLDFIEITYKRAIVAPGEMVGMIAAQSIGEPTTQMTLNTFHFAGVASKSNVTRGVPRIEEILSISENPKNPSLTIHLKKEDETNRVKAQSIMHMIEFTNLKELVKSIQICFDPTDSSTNIKEDETLLKEFYEFEKLLKECDENDDIETETNYTKWLLRMEMDNETMLEKNINMDDIHFTLKNIYKDEISCVYSDFNSDKLIFRIRMNNILKKEKKLKDKAKPLDQYDEIYIFKSFQDTLLNNVIIRGTKNIKKVIMRKIQDNIILKDDKYVNQESWVLDTVGSNLLDILSLDYIDQQRTYSNDIVETYKILGIEAARQCIYNELADVVEFDGTYINYHHMALLCDRMTYNTKMTSIFRHGINSDNIGPIAKASFEETPEMFLKAARHGELDHLRGVSANIMCGQEGFFGTSSFNVLLDINEMEQQNEEEEDENTNKTTMSLLVDESDDKCNIDNLKINDINITSKNTIANDNDDYMPDF